MSRYREEWEAALAPAMPTSDVIEFKGDERDLPLVLGRPARRSERGAVLWPVLICSLTVGSLLVVSLLAAGGSNPGSNGAIAGEADISDLPFYRSADLTPEWLPASAADAADMHRTSAFSFVDQHGAVVTDEDLTGRLTVANFFFTQCTGICPTTRAQMGWVREQFEGDERLVMLSHSVTPEHDTHQVLHDYAHSHSVPAGWHLLTGTEADVLEVAARDYFVNLRDGADYGVENLQHTENVVLLDSHRRIRGVYNGTLRVEMHQLVEDIRVLMAEEGLDGQAIGSGH